MEKKRMGKKKRDGNNTQHTRDLVGRRISGRLLCGRVGVDNLVVVVRDAPDLVHVDKAVQRAVRADGAHHAAAVGDDAALHLELVVLLGRVLREAELARDVDRLAARELHLRAAERLHEVALVRSLRAHREQDLAHVDARDHARRLAERTTHTGLQTIRTGARKHLVDAQHLERVHAHAQVETVLARLLRKVLVRADTRGLQRLAAVVLALQRHQVHAARHVLGRSVLVAKIKDVDLGVGHTTAVAALDVRLALDVAIATARTPSHFDTPVFKQKKKHKNKQTKTKRKKNKKEKTKEKEEKQNKKAEKEYAKEHNSIWKRMMSSCDVISS